MDTFRILALVATTMMTLLSYADGLREASMVCGNQVFKRVPARCSEYSLRQQCRKLRQCIKNPEKHGDKPGITTLPLDSPDNSTKEGDTVIFGCKIFNVNRTEYHISWYRNGGILFAGNQFIPPMTWNESERYQVQDTENNTHVLTITDIARDVDNGLYACKFNVGGTTGFQHSFHLNIMYIPVISGISVDSSMPDPSVHRPNPLSSNRLVFNETRDALLRCDAAGNPPPFVNWSREGSSFEVGQHGRFLVQGDLLVIKNLTRQDTGRYQCHAYNELGSVTSTPTLLQVQYPPVMDVPTTHETAGRSKSVVLECYVYSQPPARKTWMKDGRPVRVDRNRIFIAYEVNSTKLHILQLYPEIDYGNYTCHAENILGSADAYTDLNGLPTAPEIFSKNLSHHRNSYSLRWSYRHTQEDNRIFYFSYCYVRRQIYITGIRTVLGNPNAPCFNVTVPGHSTERIFSDRLTDLFPNANYLLDIYAVNKYGQGDVARHTFKTAEVDITSTPSTCTFHVGDPGYVIGPGGNGGISGGKQANYQLLVLLVTLTILQYLLNK